MAGLLDADNIFDWEAGQAADWEFVNNDFIHNPFKVE